MDSRSVLFGCFAAVVCAAGGIGALYLTPGGQLETNQIVLVCGSTAVGLLTAWLTRPSAPRVSGRLARAWPVAVGVAALVVTCAPFVAPYPAADAAAGEIDRALPRGCGGVLEAWPASPSVGDCRQLEWELADAERALRGVSDRLDRSGIERDTHRGLVDDRLRQTFHCQEARRARGMPGVEIEQRRKIAHRLQTSADALVVAAADTRLPILIEWAEHIRNDVRQLTALESPR